MNFYILESIMVNHREATITSVHGRIANVLKYAPDRANGGGRPKENVEQGDNPI